MAKRYLWYLFSFYISNLADILQLGYGLGTARAASKRHKGPGLDVDRELIDTVVMAIRAGYYHLDCAQVYNNETELGIAIKESGVPREKLHITTKNPGTRVTNTEESLTESLSKLQLDYVDLYLVHAPFFTDSPEDLQKKWADMEAILATGRAKSIGVSNFLQSHLETILATAKIIPAINQIEYHPYLQHGDLVSFHKKHNIATAAYGPLTSLTRGSPGPLDKTYKTLANKYGVGEGQIALRWCLDQGIVTITTSAKEDRLKSYLNVANFKLTAKEVQEITEIGAQKHFRGCWLNKFKEDDRS
jgi:diketogulonate reductase-like aldo/keto reductase